MERRGAVIAVIALLIVGISWPSFAVGGVVSDNAPPYYSDGSNREDFEDLRVKVLGGYVRITRRWVVDHWEWNNRWADLYLSSGQSLAEYNQEQGPQTPPTTTELPTEGDAEAQAAAAAAAYQAKANYDLFWLVRNDTAFRRASETGNTWENQLSLTLTSDDLSKYTWRDKRGSIIEYDQDGRMVGYANRFGVWVRFTRNDNGDIASIQDHHGTTVITLSYEQVPGTSSDPQYRATNLTDYTGRSVTYGYSAANGKLNNVNGVRGFDWQYQYSGDKLVAAIDPENRKTTYKFSAKGQLLSKFNADGVGASYSHSYDSVKELYYRSKTDGTGVITETWFDGQGNSVRQDIGGETQYTNSYILSSNDQGVSRLTKGYSASSSVANAFAQQTPLYVKSQIHTDGRGNKTTTTFDQYRNPIKVLYADGSSQSIQWNTNYALPTRSVDVRGFIAEYEYDGVGNLVSLTEAKGVNEERVTTYGYDNFGQEIALTQVADEHTAQAVWQKGYNVYGNITKIIDPLFFEMRYSGFDALGNSGSEQDHNSVAAADDNRWLKKYDASGNMLSNLNPFGQGNRYGYNKAGDRVLYTQANTADTIVSVNASGLPKSFTDAGQKTSTRNYDNYNRLVLQVDANDNSIELGYDALGRLSKLIDAEGNNTAYIYNKTLLSQVSYPSYQALFNYDSRNRVSSSADKTDNLEHLRGYGYDLSHNQNAATDAQGKVQSSQYDAHNRIISSTDAMNGKTLFSYDDRGNLLEVKDPEGRLTQYRYTLLNELLSETKHLHINTNKSRVYSYDGNGNVVSMVTPERQKQIYQYDAANRLRKAFLYAKETDSLPVKVVTYAFNDKDQFVGYAQSAGTALTGMTPDIVSYSQAYEYNVLNQVTKIIIDFGEFQKSYQYSYYPNGLKKTYTNPEGITYTYFYNKNNQFAAVLIPGHGQLTYGQYDWLVPKVISYPGAIIQASQYDGLLRPVSKLLNDSAENLLASASYSYDKESNVLAVAAEHGNYIYVYDDLYRLTQANYPEANAAADDTYGYDGVGNRTQENGIVSQFNDDNQLIKKEGAEFTYGENGHTLTKIQSGNFTEYIYNHEERLIAVKKNSSTIGMYSYSANGLRIKKTVGDQETWYLYNESGLAAEYSNTGELIKEYHFKPNGRWMTEPLFLRDAKNNVYYYQNDKLGSPERMFNSVGLVVWEARYSGFGVAEIVVGSVVNNLRFPGQYFDVESGLHQNYYRDYDPELGRYIQSDPIGLNGGLNTYAYVGGNPLAYLDPFGLCSTDPNAHANVVCQDVDTLSRSNRADDLIKNSEAANGIAVLIVYDDLGTPACGWGHNDSNLIIGSGITLQEADAFYDADVASAEAAVRNLVGNLDLSQNEFDALVDLAYNVGPTELNATNSPGLNAAIAAGNYTAISNQLIYTQGDGRQLRGLVTRSNSRTTLFRRAD